MTPMKSKTNLRNLGSRHSGDGAKVVLIGLLAFFVTPALAGPEIESWSTAAGARVLFVETRSLPILDVSVEFPAGSSFDPQGQSGLAAMTLRMMRKGTKSLDEHRISEKLADVGARLSERLDLDRGGYALRTLSDNSARIPALKILGEVLSTPDFPAGILEREKKRTIASIEEGRTRPGVIADLAFQKQFYGDHPYGTSSSGEPDSVAALTRNDLVSFHRRLYVANSAVVTIVGDVSRQQAQHIAEQLTRELPRTDALALAVPHVPQVMEKSEIAIAHSASQAHIQIGMPGVRRGDPDYFPLWLAGQILGGGGLTSLLNEELREKRGLTYSTYSYFSPYLRSGPFVIQLQTRKDQAWEALDVATTTLEDFVRDGPTAAQLRAAKQYVIGGFALNIDSNAELVGYLAMIGFYRLPLDYLDRFPEMIEAVSLADIKEALARRIQPDKTVTVVVGPPSRL